MGVFVRQAQTASGATAVQIVQKRGGRVLSIEHIGSAHTGDGLAVLHVHTGRAGSDNVHICRGASALRMIAGMSGGGHMLVPLTSADSLQDPDGADDLLGIPGGAGSPVGPCRALCSLAAVNGMLYRSKESAKERDGRKRPVAA